MKKGFFFLNTFRQYFHVLKERKTILLFLAIYGFSPLIPAQESGNFSFSPEGKIHYGFIIPHRTGMKNLITGHVKALEINYDIPTYGKKEWEQIYNYPTWGLSCFIADLGNPVQLGFATGLFPYVNFPKIKTERFRFSYHVGWGLGYVSKAFDRTENYKNTIIGSNMNAIISLGLESELKVSGRLSANAGMSFTHFSNGAFTVPNLGINIPSVNLGISYLAGNPNQEFRRDSIGKPKKNYEVSFIFSGGLKSVYPLGNTKKYPAFSFSTTFGTFRSQKNRLVAGMDVFYNTALFDYFQRAEIPVSGKWEMIQPGVSLNYIATVSRINIIIGMGTYIYSRYTFDGKYYHRIGMRYRINEHLFANLTLKSHFFKADFSEWGIGYNF